MRNLKPALSVAMLMSMALSPMAMAQNSTAAHPAGSADAVFVTKASASGMTEVQASQLADAHASSPAVKSFAARMVTDHTKANDQLESIAQKDSFTPSPSPTAMQQRNITHLSGLNGSAFDKAYSKMMLKDHREAVALFKKESMSGANGDLKSFAGDTLPTLQEHLAMAKKLPTQ